MKTLHISVVDKIATYHKRDGEIVCGNSDYELKFNFDKEWEEFPEKTARIVINGEYKDRPISEKNTCTLPTITNVTRIEVGVYARADDTELCTTTPAAIGCKLSILCGSPTPASDADHDKEYASEAQAAASEAKAAAFEARLVVEEAKAVVGGAATAVEEAKAAAEKAEDAAEMLTGINAGEGKKALAVMSNDKEETPKASGDYSVAIGTDDTSVLGELESAAGGNFTAKMPEAKGDMSLSYGISTEANSMGASALGFGTTAGVKGYYWYSITLKDGGAVITLSKNQAMLGLLGNSYGVTEEEIDWEVGDYISIVNNQKYAFCAKITEIKTVSETPLLNAYDTVAITVDSAVFGANAYSQTLVLSPDDKTIFAVSRIQDESTLAHKLVARSGAVELGWGAYAIGLNNLSLGAFGFVAGANNVLAGDFGAVFGRDNLGAYGNVIGGGWNESTGLHSALFGRLHTNKGNYNAQSGYHNQIQQGDFNLQTGAENNHIKGSGNIEGGYNNRIENSTYSIIGGNNHIINGDQVNVSGKAHKLQNRSHYNDVSGSGHTLDGAIHNNVSGKENSLTSSEDNVVGGNKNELKTSHDNLVGGHYHTIDNSCYNLVGGEYNTVKSGRSLVSGAYNKILNHYTGVIGYGLETTAANQLIVGQYNDLAPTPNALDAFIVAFGSKDARKNVFTVPRNGVPRKDTDAITYGFLKSYAPTGGGGSESGGADGITPQLRINSNTNMWEVSYDNGSTWTSLNVKATGGNGITPQLRINSNTNMWEVSYNNGSTWASLGVKATGTNGVGIDHIDVEMSDLDGGPNIIKIVLTNGNEKQFTVRNGSPGSSSGGSSGDGENTTAAKTYAERAEAAAGRASTSESNASGYADDASEYANAASESAHAAAESLNQSLSAKAEANTAKGAAQGYADEASQSALAASQSVTFAAEYAAQANSAKVAVNETKKTIDGIAEDIGETKDAINATENRVLTALSDANKAKGAAQGYADNASEYANAASESAHSAAGVESRVLQARAEAVSAASSAKSSEDEASQSALAASQSASFAANYAAQANSAKAEVNTAKTTVQGIVEDIGETKDAINATETRVAELKAEANTAATNAASSATSAESAAIRAEEAVRNATTIGSGELATAINIFRYNGSEATLVKTLTSISRSPRLNMEYNGRGGVTFMFGDIKLLRNSDSDIGYDFMPENQYAYTESVKEIRFAYVDGTNPSKYLSYRNPADANFFADAMNGGIKILSAGTTYNIALWQS